MDTEKLAADVKYVCGALSAKSQRGEHSGLEEVQNEVIRDLLAVIKQQHEALETAGQFYKRNSLPPLPAYLVAALRLSVPLVKGGE